MKMDKKGFTLAELLIVIAIIAVLIAIAIPVFSGPLKDARIQTDHANIRSAYAIMQMSNISGEIEVKSSSGSELRPITDFRDNPLVFQKDGSFAASSSKNDAYVTMENGGTECSSSVACQSVADKKHESGKVIMLTYNETAGKLELIFGNPTD